MTGVGGERLPFVDRPLPPAFVRRTAVIAPGQTCAYHHADWRDAIVVVERGSIEVVCVGGTRHSFGRGDVLYLDGLPVRCLRNHGHEPAVLVAVSRHAPPA